MAEALVVEQTKRLNVGLVETRRHLNEVVALQKIASAQEGAALARQLERELRQRRLA